MYIFLYFMSFFFVILFCKVGVLVGSSLHGEAILKINLVWDVKTSVKPIKNIYSKRVFLWHIKTLVNIDFFSFIFIFIFMYYSNDFLKRCLT